MVPAGQVTKQDGQTTDDQAVGAHSRPPDGRKANLVGISAVEGCLAAEEAACLSDYDTEPANYQMGSVRRFQDPARQV